MRPLIIVAAVMAFALACRSGQGGPPSRPEAKTQKDPYLILSAELEAAGRDNLYDAVRQLRPNWFTRRTRQQTGETNILVYFDDRQMGSVSTMRSVSPRAVQSVRYLSPTEAQVRFGQTNVGRPAILLESLRQP